MDLFPAIDIRAGRVVRLIQGEAGRETAYHYDPVAQAERLVGAGARWIHVVDLDRAFGSGDNLGVIRELADRVRGKTRVQVGGGIRTLSALRAVLELGIERAVLGTVVVTEPALVPEALGLAGRERVAVGLDAKGGRVAIRGWVETTDLLVDDVCRRVVADGTQTIIYTDVGRDGMLNGPDLAGAVRLQAHGAAVIVSGGVSSLADISGARAAGLHGVIVGRAIYEGRFTVEQALESARGAC
ncbi:MAG TPA: 1-(5-phosphoribosyl)-5-[(5-phosphoribosylamino)methylideneamino] imidazole-4-carboxamide isomerase [Gemmatimonadales bacterium]|nr:1-(5-phosphoribosyl)-5-[(5-phosphoribosylamino)methylideneamino] imidazole-4-carboxamide isomerase [Gemmatimonadales bacterium]